MKTQATGQHSSVEMAEIAKLLFKEHGGDLGLVIVALHLEQSERIATLEAAIRELQSKKR